MRAVVLSDLHLGTVTRRDLLRRAEPRAALLERVAGADHVVLLGDVLELRELPLPAVLHEAEPFFRELGEAAGDARITIVPGNHDHRLSWPLTDGRSDPLPISASTTAPATEPFALIAEWLGNGPDLAYPGVWLRPDVYATHGHYLDCHLELPTFERLAIAATARVVRAEPGDGIRSPSEHEAAVAPLYSLAYSLAQASRRGALFGGGRTVSTWERLAGEDGRRVGARLVAGLVLPATVGVLNRTGFGPLKADLSGPSLRRSGLRAMATVAGALGLHEAHVLFGHTHRSGPWPGDDAAEWELAGGGRLVNTGSWVHEPAFVRTRGRASPYWPGVIAVVEDEGPPRLERLLDELPATGT